MSEATMTITEARAYAKKLAIVAFIFGMITGVLITFVA